MFPAHAEPLRAQTMIPPWIGDSGRLFRYEVQRMMNASAHE